LALVEMAARDRLYTEDQEEIDMEFFRPDLMRMGEQSMGSSQKKCLERMGSVEPNGMIPGVDYDDYYALYYYQEPKSEP
jgi:hypothetical protein